MWWIFDACQIMAKFLWPVNRQEKSSWKKIVQKEKSNILTTRKILVFFKYLNLVF